MRTLANMFKALSDETRLEMLALLLNKQELCVCHFESLLGISQSRASRHLRYLLNAGLLADRRAGTWVHYRLTPEPGPEAAALLAALPDILGEQRLQRAAQSAGTAPQLVCDTPLDRRPPVEVKVLGAGCATCNELYQATRKALEQTGVTADLTKVEDFKEIARFGILAVPALVIDGQVKSAGKIPALADISTWLTTAAMAAHRSSSGA